MEIIRCLIADDEPIARKILEKYVADMPNLTLVNSCKNAFEVLECLQEETIDLLFLDINMPKFSGISLLKTLKVKPAVIITTAYPEYAVEGFELSVIDYLLKPFSFERFLQAVLKIKQEEKVQNKEVIIKETKEADHSIFVKSDKRLVKVVVDEINYVEAYGNYIKIFTNKMILTPQTLSEFLTKLPNNFIRVHKSFVINFDKINMLDGNQILLENGAKVIIGKSFRKELLSRIDKASE